MNSFTFMRIFGKKPKGTFYSKVLTSSTNPSFSRASPKLKEFMNLSRGLHEFHDESAILLSPVEPEDEEKS